LVRETLSDEDAAPTTGGEDRRAILALHFPRELHARRVLNCCRLGRRLNYAAARDIDDKASVGGLEKKIRARMLFLGTYCVG
jgi:hypothetical protein